MTAPRPRGRPYWRLEREVRKEGEVCRVRRDGEEVVEDWGRWPARAAWESAVSQAWKLAV